MLIPYQFVNQEDARKVAADLAKWREPIWGIDDFPSPDGWRYAVVEMVWKFDGIWQIQVSNEEGEVIGFWGHAIEEVKP